VVVIALLSISLFSTFTPAFIVAIGWMVFFVIVGNLALRFLCPRCGGWFFEKWWYSNTFARRCVHCGLPKYADPRQKASERIGSDGAPVVCRTCRQGFPTTKTNDAGEYRFENIPWLSRYTIYAEDHTKKATTIGAHPNPA
jgi:hypothetical protein